MVTISGIGERYGHVLEVGAYARTLKQSADVVTLLEQGPAITEVPRADQMRFRSAALDVHRAVNAVITAGSDEGVLIASATAARSTSRPITISRSRAISSITRATARSSATCARASRGLCGPAAASSP